MRATGFRKKLWGVLLADVVLAGSMPAQTGCPISGYRVLARRWDAVLRMGWELRQDCAHPEWPLRSVAIGVVTNFGGATVAEVAPVRVSISPPILVRAGDAVRLWLQDEAARIEMSGVAEQSAHKGERVLVRITRQDIEEGLTVQHIAGTVRGVGDVEIER
jgi:hypothetical protein